MSAGRDGESAQDSPVPSHGGHALVDRLNAGEPYAVAFGGQGSAWLENLEELVSSAGIESEIATLAGEADVLLAPVARDCRRAADRLRAAALDARAGGRGVGAQRQAADLRGHVGAGGPADPDRRDPCADAVRAWTWSAPRRWLSPGIRRAC